MAMMQFRLLATLVHVRSYANTHVKNCNTRPKRFTSAQAYPVLLVVLHLRPTLWIRWGPLTQQPVAVGVAATAVGGPLTVDGQQGAFDQLIFQSVDKPVNLIGSRHRMVCLNVVS